MFTQFDPRWGCAVLVLLVMLVTWYYVLLPLGAKLIR